LTAESEAGQQVDDEAASMYDPQIDLVSAQHQPAPARLYRSLIQRGDIKPSHWRPIRAEKVVDMSQGSAETYTGGRHNDDLLQIFCRV